MDNTLLTNILLKLNSGLQAVPDHVIVALNREIVQDQLQETGAGRN